MSNGRTTLSKRIARLFKLKRENELNISLASVSAATGISTATINRIELGQLLKPTFEDVLTLSRYYRITLAEIVGEQTPTRKGAKANSLLTLVDSVVAEAKEDELDYAILMLSTYLRHLRTTHGREE